MVFPIVFIVLLVFAFERMDIGVFAESGDLTFEWNDRHFPTCRE